jgi:S1-C subfamily serine protease
MGTGWSLGPAPTPPPALPPVGAPPSRHTGLKVVGAMVFAAALVGSGFGIRAVTEDQNAATVVRAPSASAPTVPSVTVDPTVEPLAAVAEALSPSVVQIEVTNGLGSGVVYRDGLILTNAHVVGPDTSVTVRTADGQALEGRVLGTDTGTDIAVVEVEGADLPVVPLSETDPIVGQTAVALGSPFGLEQTVTAGIVSAVNRPVDNDKGVVVNMIQTDASINPGNSGGALVNRNGQLIGINTAIFSQSGENNGIGFAIPIETARKTADKIVNGQSVAKAGLGLSGPPETPTGDAGAYVESLVAGGAAEAGGIQVGDTIVAVDGDEIRSFEQLRGVVSSYSPGDTVTVEVLRDGRTVAVEVTLGTLGGS